MPNHLRLASSRAKLKVATDLAELGFCLSISDITRVPSPIVSVAWGAFGVAVLYV